MVMSEMDETTPDNMFPSVSYWGPHDMASFTYPSFEARVDHGPANQ